MQPSIINTTITAYLRNVLDTGGYNTVMIYKNKEPTPAALPLVRYTYMLLPMTGLKQTNDGGIQNNYRLLLTVSVFGSLEGSGRQDTEAIGGLLRTSFNNKRGQVNKIQSDITIDLTTAESEVERVCWATFQVNAVVSYP